MSDINSKSEPPDSPPAQPQPTTTEQTDEISPRSGTGLIAVLGSVLAAIFGIQSHERRQRDFNKGKTTDFIIMGIVFVIFLVFGMIFLVNSVLSE